MLTRECPESHEGHVDGNIHQFGQLDKLFGSPGEHNPSADIQDRLPGFGDGLGRLLDLPFVSVVRRVVPSDRDGPRIREVGLVHGHVFGNVHQNRSRPAGRRDVEGLFDRHSEIIDILHQEIVLGAGTAQTDIVRLLKGIISDQARRHLAGKADKRDRIHRGIHQRRDDIAHAGSGGHQRDARFSRRFCISFGHVAGALLMAGEDHVDVLLLMEDVEYFEHNPPWQGKERFHSLALETLDENFCSCEFHASPHVTSAGASDCLRSHRQH